ncbi:MAG: proline--tRNA ligase [Candidatus Dadabacteria bacterium]|nr:proline--tRNA ligase [Candidatus Dadabacteria bacterium]
MRYTQFLLPTLKETPADAEVLSHKLMIRAGMIRKLAAGIYNYLPLGLRSIRKVETIVREEMNRAGAQELLMPAVLPGELWRETGRWDKYGKELLRFEDRAGREFCLGPTHEEIITDIARKEIRSYKQLPINLYQIQTKFRDEIRPRFGVMRAREFIMKDAYSFDADEEGADKSYWVMYEAYCRIFERCGLEYRAVLADTGNIGGNFSHEFMVLAPTGEDVIMSCEGCGYAANLEFAEIGELSGNAAASDGEEGGLLSDVSTPDCKSVDDVAALLAVDKERIIKTMIVETDLGPYAALLSGDHELSLMKLRKAIGADTVEFATPERIMELTKGPMGFSGPVGLKIKVVADRSVEGIKNGVTGANKKDFHLKNVNVGRDFSVEGFADIRVAVDGDPCPECDGGALRSSRGIEVGHVFKLGTKYCEALNATFVDEGGKEKFFIMGCYGIGIGRTVAAAIEQNNDEGGIIFPPSLAPFQVVVLPLRVGDERVRSVSENIYSDLIDNGVEVIIDDRDESPGFKFKDAELIGVPIQVVVGPKGLKDESVEVKLRDGTITKTVPVASAVKELMDLLGPDSVLKAKINV